MPLRFGKGSCTAGPSSRSSQISLLVEGEAAVREHRLQPAVGVAQHERVGRHVVGRAAEHLHRLIERLAALEALHDERISRLRERAGPEVAPDEQRVLVDPRRVPLRLGEPEAAVDELLRHDVELADLIGILAAVRQRDETAPLLGAEAGRAVPHPVRALACRERVDVEHGLPFGVRAAIARRRRATQDAAHVRWVLPEVVDRAAADVGRRDAVRRLDDAQRVAMQLLVARIAPQGAERRGVVGLHPLHRAVALDVLQPDVGVVGRGRRGAHRCVRCGARRGSGMGSHAGAKKQGAERREVSHGSASLESRQGC